MGQIPQSEALAEATESLTELLSRDPEGYSKRDRARIVEELREMRARWMKAELAGEHKRGAKAPGKSAGRELLSKAPDELDL